MDDPNYRPAEDASEFVAGLGVSVAGDAKAFATALGEAIRADMEAITGGDPVPSVETEVLDDVPVVTVILNGIPDDSSSRLTYVVRYADVSGTLAPTDALRFIYCNRGISEGLCV